MKGYSQNPNGDVALVMNPSDYQTLMLALGIAAGWLSIRADGSAANTMAELSDRINHGNVNYVPYNPNHPLYKEIEKETTTNETQSK